MVGTSSSLSRLSAMLLGAAVLANCGDASAVDPSSSLPSLTTSAIRELPGLGGFWARARGINEFGRVVGEASLGLGRSHAFSWSEIGGIRDLGTLGGPSSGAMAINSFSQLAGWANTSDGTTHAFRMTVGDATMRDLGMPIGGVERRRIPADHL